MAKMTRTARWREEDRQAVESNGNTPTLRISSSCGPEPEPKPKAIRPRRVPPYTPFPLVELPPVLRDYTGASADAIGCDPALVALPALAVAAGCLGNSCTIQLKRGWTEPSVIWSVTITPSGQRKSPGWAAATDPLMAYQCDLADNYRAERTAYDDALAEWMD